MLNFLYHNVCRCDEETIESEPTDEDYSNEGDEDADASYENYTDKQTDHDVHARSDLQNSPHSSIITSTTTTTTTTTESFSAMIAEPENIPDKGKLSSIKSIHKYMSIEYLTHEKRIFIFIDSVCPEICRCTANFKLVNCSRRLLQEIPAKLPKEVEKLDLSNNQLSRLNISALKECVSLRELLLGNNKIESIVDKAVSFLIFFFFVFYFVL